MAKKMVTDRSADASYLSAAAAIFPREISPALKEVFSPLVGEGETAPDVELLPEFAARLVNQRLERLIEADKANIDAQAALLGPRKRRDGALGSASDTLHRIRDLCRGLYGRQETARVIPDEQRIPQRPKAFLHTAEHVLERLRDLERELPPQTLEGIDIERVQLSANFTSTVKELDDSLVEVDLKRREAEITQEAKNEALRDLGATFGAAIRLLEGLAILAGKPNLAARVRPTRRRRSSGNGAEPTEEEAPVADSETESEGSTPGSTDSAA